MCQQKNTLFSSVNDKKYRKFKRMCFIIVTRRNVSFSYYLTIKCVFQIYLFLDTKCLLPLKLYSFQSDFIYDRCLPTELINYLKIRCNKNVMLVSGSTILKKDVSFELWNL